ncbi:MAG: cytochrome c [Deltaproteobacteria bacterium]|nr:cytochrome c [Deltaproteobacteria bacterium]
MRGIVLVAVAACGGASSEPPVSAIPQLQVASGGEVGVVELGDSIVAFDRTTASVVRDGVIVARVVAPTVGGRWDMAAGLVAPDGATWAIGLSANRLWRITPSGELEPAGDRLGIGDARVLSIAAAGSTFAIGLEGALVASRDGVHLMRFAGVAAPHLAAAKDRVAIWRGNTIEVLDLAGGARVEYVVDGASYVGFRDAASDHAHVVVGSARDVYVQERGALRRTSIPKNAQLTVSGSTIWALDGESLQALDHHTWLPVTGASGAGRIHGSASGDVWLTRRSKLVRYSLGVSTDEVAWQAVVAPVFERACAGCHRAGGSADFDLSTAAAWSVSRASVKRVVGNRTMPPPGSPISDADRAALEAWLAK